MPGYFYFIMAIVIAGCTACTSTYNRANSFMTRRDMNPRARDRIQKPQHDNQTNEHSKNNYHELKHRKKNYHQLKHTKKKYHQREHWMENHHKQKKEKDDHLQLSHLKHSDKLNHTNEKDHNRVKISLDEEEGMNVNETEAKQKKPDIKFPKTYHATGLLTLPYDGIMEPFEIWYAGDLNMSRIDYYHGVDKTFQRGDLEEYGVYIKEIPMHKAKVGDNNKHSKSCWYEEGDEYEVVKPQSIVPMDLSHFKIIGEEYRSGTLTIKLRRHVKFGNLKNTYTLWVSKEKPHRPIRYETEGFDLLLEGYYDHYYLDYITFSDWYFDYLIMEVPKGSWCYTEALHAKTRYFVNPMSEFIHKPHEVDKHYKRIEKEFKKYKLKHGKSYKDVKEHSKRRNIYRHNTRFIRSKNRARLNYTLAVNHLADLTPEEFRVMNDLLNDEEERDSEFLKDQFPSNDEVPLVNYTEPSQPLPENLDWREYGNNSEVIDVTSNQGYLVSAAPTLQYEYKGVTGVSIYGVISPIRGQSMCGSCWAFSTAGMLEGAYKIATGKDIEFSAQMLVDCTYGFKNYGCRGGWPWKAMQWVIRNGIATRQSYGRYLAEEGLCHCGPKDNCTIIYPTSYGDVMKANKTAMKVTLATYGPVSVGINSAPKSFKFYREGVYDDFDCDDVTEHSVMIVGYGKQSYGLSHWVIKNSWGPFWGRGGYMKISNDVDTCGILSSNGVVANFRNSSHGFPFERMKKVVTPHYSNIEGRKKDEPKPIFNAIPFQ